MTEMPTTTYAIIINLSGLYDKLHRCKLTSFGHTAYYVDTTKDIIVEKVSDLKKDVKFKYGGNTWVKISDGCIYLFFEDKKIAESTLHCLNLYRQFIQGKL